MNLTFLYLDAVNNHKEDVINTLYNFEFTVRREQIPVFSLGSSDPRSFARISTHPDINATAIFNMTGRTLNDYMDYFSEHMMTMFRVFDSTTKTHREFILENARVLTYDTYKEFNGAERLRIKYIATGIRHTND